MKQSKGKEILVFLLVVSFIVLITNSSLASGEGDFINNLNESYSLQPYYVEKQSLTRFIIRPNAIPLSGEDDYIEIYFGSTADMPTDSTSIDVMSEDGSSQAPGFNAGDGTGGDGDDIYWSETAGGRLKVAIKRQIIQDQLEIGNTHQIQLGSLSLCKFTLRSVLPAPVIHADITGYQKEYEDPLSSDKIYYVPDDASEPGTFRINNGATMDRLRHRVAKDITVQPLSSGVQITGFITNYPGDIKDNWVSADSDDNNVTTKQIWTDYFEIEKNIPDPIDEKLQYLANQNQLEVKIYRVVGENFGTGGGGIAQRNYYIVRDNNAPTVEPIEPLLKSKGDSFARVRRPELNFEINDTISGVGSKEDVSVKYRRLEREENSLPSDLTAFNSTDMPIRSMEIRDLEEARETRTGTEAGVQQVEVVPDNEMGEGEYAVLVNVEDKAGNSSDNFIFYLKIDQTNPRINNVSMNNKIIDLASDQTAAVGAADLDLYLEAYGANDIIYGIRYMKEGNKSDWFLAKRNDVDYISQFIERSLLSWSATGDTFKNAEGKAKDGPYEVYIWVDEEEIYEDSDGDDKDDFHTLVGENGSGFFDPDGPNGDIVDNYVLDETDTDASHIERFKIRVDNTPPEKETGSLKYYESYPGSLVELTAGSPIKIYQGNPVFQIKFNNASEIKKDNIQITFTNQNTDRRVTGEVINLNWNKETNVHTFEFAPVIKLTPGTYTLQINPTDIFGNEAEEEFKDLFEIVTTASGDVSFSINDGERLNVNQSSALEININSPNLKPKEKGLRIMINGSPVVVQGKIVNKIVTTEGGGQDIKYRDEDYFTDNEYYKAEDYQADGYDVLFPGNDKRTIIIFSRLPLPTGRNRVKVEVVDENGVLTNHSVEFMVDNYRNGFGFGRLLPMNGE